ncbi:MAG: hypothetical protein P8H35_00045 [Flavobacteriales bacterium]|nr:hypothetical protein [Flavobacteriales bacterium]
MSKAYFKFLNTKDIGFHHVESTINTLEEDILEAFVATFWDMNEIEEDSEEAKKANRIMLDLGYNVGSIEYRDKDENLVLEVEFDIW